MNILSFFDYKDYFHDYHGQDMFGIKHILLMSISFIVMVILLIITRLKYQKGVIKDKHLELYCKVLSIFLPLHETIKIIWETTWDIKTDKGFNWGGLLPLYLCSMFIYVMPLIAFGKGKAKKAGINFMATIGIVGGISNFIVFNILNTYPIFTYASMVSFIYHFLMVFTGLLFWIFGWFKPSLESTCLGYIPLFVFSIIVIPVNFILDHFNFYPDYMLLMRSGGVPIISNIGSKMYDNNLAWLFTIIMLILYFILTLTINMVASLINKLKQC